MFWPEWLQEGRRWLKPDSCRPWIPPNTTTPGSLPQQDSAEKHQAALPQREDNPGMERNCSTALLLHLSSSTGNILSNTSLTHLLQVFWLLTIMIGLGQLQFRWRQHQDPKSRAWVGFVKNRVLKICYQSYPEAVIFPINLSSLFCGFLYSWLPSRDLKEEAGGEQQSATGPLAEVGRQRRCGQGWWWRLAYARSKKIKRQQTMTEKA